MIDKDWPAIQRRLESKWAEMGPSVSADDLRAVLDRVKRLDTAWHESEKRCDEADESWAKVTATAVKYKDLSKELRADLKSAIYTRDVLAEKLKLESK